jgi:hypothetical protein
MESLWSDLADDGETFESPEWHQDELRKTDAAFAAGRIEVIDWTEGKKELRQRFE